MSQGWAATTAAGGGLLAASWAALQRPAGQRADVRAGAALRRLGGQRADPWVVATTDLGSIYAVVGMAGVLAAAGRPRTAADVLGIGAAAWSGAQASKTRVRRQRPYEADGVRRLIRAPTGSSFPSGHAAVGAAVGALLAARSRGWPGRLAFTTLAAYVPVSRVHVGVHYPTDALGGAGMGLALAGLWGGPLRRFGWVVLGTQRLVARWWQAAGRAWRR